MLGRKTHQRRLADQLDEGAAQGVVTAVGLVEMVAFVITVLVAYVYVWRRGGLEWD